MSKTCSLCLAAVHHNIGLHHILLKSSFLLSVQGILVFLLLLVVIIDWNLNAAITFKAIKTSRCPPVKTIELLKITMVISTLVYAARVDVLL